MSAGQRQGLRPLKCDKWKEIRGILIPNGDSTKSNYIQLNSLVDVLFLEYFQSLFKHYDEKADGNKRRFGAPEISLISPTDDDIWIFGYGSLVWKADFPYIDKKQGYIEGYQRRFFQHSIDHRGTRSKPGRVATLVPSNEPIGRVYGVAYRIAKQQKETVLAHLDYREKNGYQRCTLKFTEFDTDNSFDIVMYIATNNNDSFAGGDENNLQPIADQIYKSAGPSGSNREYLFNLAEAMRQLFPGVEDEHLFKLEEMVKKREQSDRVLVGVIKNEIRSILMNDPVEQAIEEFKTLKENCRREGFLDGLYEKVQSENKIDTFSLK